MSAQDRDAATDYPMRWLREQRGGYGFIQRVPCRVLDEYASGRLKIAVLNARDEEVIRYVHRTKVVTQSEAINAAD